MPVQFEPSGVTRIIPPVYERDRMNGFHPARKRAIHVPIVPGGQQHCWALKSRSCGQCECGGWVYPMRSKKWTLSFGRKETAMVCTGASPHLCQKRKNGWEVSVGSCAEDAWIDRAHLVIESAGAFEVIYVSGVRFASPKPHIRDFHITPV
jgi:hypothetical protein